MTAITEAASDNLPPRKRGRPRRFSSSPEWARVWEMVGPPRNGETRRARTDNLYAMLAASILDEQAEEDRSPEAFRAIDGKQTVLAELGRLAVSGPDCIPLCVQAARDICAMRPAPTAKRAVAMLRGYRLRETASASPSVIASAILRAITQVMDRYPPTDRLTVLAGLQMAAESWGTFAE